MTTFSGYFLLFFINDHLRLAVGTKYIIGAVFDKNSEEINRAFEYEINRLNHVERGESRIELENVTSILDSTDSFAVSNAICYQLRKGVYGIIGISNASALSTIQSYSNTFKVPFLFLSMAQNSSNNGQFQLFMRPVYINGLLDVIKEYDWRHILYIYDTDEGLLRLQQLFQAVNSRELPLDIDVKRVSDHVNCYDTLKNMHLQDDSKDIRVLLDLPIKMSENIILKVMRDTQVKNHKFHFLLGELGIEEMDRSNFDIGGINITGFQLTNQSSVEVKGFLDHWKYAYVSGMESKIKFESALVIDAVNLFRKALKRLPQDMSGWMPESIKCTDDSTISAHNGTGFMNILKNSPEFDGVTGRIKFDQYGFRKDFKLQLLAITITMGLAKVGDWSPDAGLRMQTPEKVTRPTNDTNRKRNVTTILEDPYVMYVNDEVAARKPTSGRHNFKGFCMDLADAIADIMNFTFEVFLVPDKKYGEELANGTWNGMIGQLVRQEPPYVMWIDSERERQHPQCGKENFHGFCVDLANAVAEIVGFDYDICLVKDGKYGEKLDNETWNGMVGELTRNEVDMAIAPMSISSQRERVVDFTKPYMSLGISIMIKKTALKKANVFSFMDPLSYEIWMCILFAYIGVSVVLFLVSRFSPTEWHVEEGTNITNDFSISNSLWYSLGAFMQQGCDISPRSVSGRIVGSVWWFFTLIIISSYTANLAAFLTVERMLTPIESAEDLAKQTEIQYGTLDAGSTKNFFKQSKVAVYERMWAYMTSASPSVFVPKNLEGIRKVREGNYAFLIESTTNDYINMRKPCNTMKVGTNLDSKGYGIATPVGSDLRDKLTLAVLKLRESGELENLRKKWWDNLSECPLDTSSQDGGQTELTLNNVAGIFYILVAGLILAVVIACFEFLYKSKIDSKRSKTSFGSVLRCKARLSFRGSLDRDTPASSACTPLRKSGSTYTYTGPNPIVGPDGFTDSNTHTQV